MPLPRPYRDHLNSHIDLVTTYEETRAGFVNLALEKNRRATPSVAQARALKAAASQAKTPSALLDIPGIKPALLTAAGVSDKAIKHMQEEDKAEAIRGLIANFLEPAGSAFIEELVFRFLLIRGDTLGGSLRNLGGALAERKLTRNIIATLSLARKSYYWLHGRSRTWIDESEDDVDIEDHLGGLSWSNGEVERTLLYNRTVPFVEKNIDLCLLDCVPQQLKPASLSNPAIYVALGELKGGIDPAGADEHWKTANTALDRVRRAFDREGDHSPFTFFVGAAVVEGMAKEIWDQLESGTLANAANLTNEDQIASLCRWLCSI